MLAFAFGPAPALAEKRVAAAHDARRDRLEGLDKDDLARLAPQLALGPVALVEFADMDADQLPAINVALSVNAPAGVLEALVAAPEGYPRFMPTLDAVDVLDRRGAAIVYDWSFDLTVLRMRGRNVMTVYPAAPERPEAGMRVTIDSTEGDLGRGRYVLRILPRGPSSSLLVLSMRLDLREANYVARQLAKAARSVNRSANLALAFSMALHFKTEAERRAKVTTHEATAPVGLTKPVFDLRALAPLLSRGDLVLLTTSGSRLDRLAVLGLVGATREKVHTAMRDARAFGSALVPGSAATVVSQHDGMTVFDWNIDLPLVGVEGRMRMSEASAQMAIDATSGALAGGQWRFELAPVGKRATLVTGWARFGFEDSTWLLEKLVESDPFLGHGIAAASEVMLVRALRSRATAP